MRTIGPREMAQLIRALTALKEAQVWFPTPTQKLNQAHVTPLSEDPANSSDILRLLCAHHIHT